MSCLCISLWFLWLSPKQQGLPGNNSSLSVQGLHYPSASHMAGLEAQGPGPAGCSILCQACDKQTQVVLHPVPMADFTSNFMRLEVANLTLGIYPPGVIKSILFQTVAVLFQEEQLEIQIPLFQKDFSPAGKLRDGRCKSKFP